MADHNTCSTLVIYSIGGFFSSYDAFDSMSTPSKEAIAAASNICLDNHIDQKLCRSVAIRIQSAIDSSLSKLIEEAKKSEPPVFMSTWPPKEGCPSHQEPQRSETDAAVGHHEPSNLEVADKLLTGSYHGGFSKQRSEQEWEKHLRKAARYLSDQREPRGLTETEGVIQGVVDAALAAERENG